MQPVQQEIQVRWPDLDGLGHVNHSAVLTYLEVGRDAFLAARGVSPDDYVVRHCVIDYRGELRPRRSTARYRLTGVKAGSTSVTLTETLLDDSGAVAVAATFTIVMWDPASRTSRRLTDVERRNLVPDSTEEREPVRYARSLLPGQRAELHVLDVDTGATQLLLSSTDVLFEAPNWHPDGRWIAVNGDGVLHRVDVEAPTELQEIPASGLPELNNDHLISPDGRWFYVSANDWHLYRLPWDGGDAERVTTEKAPERVFRHFLHGVSPDGGTLAYVGTEVVDGDEWARRALWLLDLDSGDERLLGNGYSVADGPDFSPDGRSVYFNSEVASTVEGHAQLFRHDLRDGSVEQLTSDERVNWFPHPSPDGRRLVYLSYPPGTVGHPPDLPVELRVIDLPGGRPRTLVALPGGQGTINVPSWAPNGRQLAYVAYPTP